MHHAETLSCSWQAPALPATLRDLTQRGGAFKHPLVIDLTRLTRLVVDGGAYTARDVRGTPADPAAAAASPLLPGLRTLELRNCGDIADALRVLRHPRLRPPPGAALSLHADGGRTPQWPLYLDASPRPLPAEGDCRAWLPAGSAALRLRMPQMAFRRQ